jgi:2-oxoglutarate dehydrogenase E1 component
MKWGRSGQEESDFPGTYENAVMSDTGLASRWNLDAIESAYEQWQRDPSSVEEKWRVFFEGFELGASGGARLAGSQGLTGVVLLISAYRDMGHLIAHLDPLNEPPANFPLLEPSEFGLRPEDLDREFDASPFVGLGRVTLRQLIQALRETYCGSIGVEYKHILDTRVRRWLQERMEPCRNKPNYSAAKKLWLLKQLHYAELFEQFLQARFVGQKRFSLEGAETLIPIMECVVEQAAETGAREIVLGMAHRGRLNVLANILRKPYQEIFAEFEENYLPESKDGDGDVKYHLGFSSDRTAMCGAQIHLSLTPNPSHLEAVNPVVEGRCRAKQWLFGDRERKLGIPFLIHGDAAFAGQGLVAETLNLSNLQGYRTGGTIHVIVNNQIGFTTAPHDARSTTYCTDVAKMIQVPIFHVNGEDPEAAAFVTELAVDFRQTFRRDVVIDMYCYRRHGHNEGDEPSFTQPLMYKKIKDRQTLTEIYTEKLVLSGEVTADETTAMADHFKNKLQSALEEIKTSPPKQLGMRGFSGRWEGLSAQFTHLGVDTSVPLETLERVSKALATFPPNFHPHPKIVRLFENRKKEFDERKPLDWTMAEMMAFGSLVLEGTPVRLSGQDSRRGTFSQRHAMVCDAETGEPYYALCHLAPDQAPFSVYDSLLSESAVLGFEFGFSLDSPRSLVLWEAQFGDFANGAQVIIDQFLVCSESKWQRDSGLVLLLPHGYEGQGPEHSSGRLERYLQLCGEDNIQVCNLSTPAQYFHVLRRQIKRSFRKPLVIMTPKSMLRHKLAVSPVEQLTSDRFHEVLDDSVEDPERIRRVLFCSGKLYYDLLEKRAALGNKEVAIIRVEQLYPFPVDPLRDVLLRYRKAKEWAWVQEESLNMGAWSFMEPRLRALAGSVKYLGRDTSASPATGSRKIHLREQQELVETAMTGMLPHLVRAYPLQKKRREIRDGEIPAKDAERRMEANPI